MPKNYVISIPVGVFWKVVLPAALLFTCVGALAGVILVDRLVMPRIVKADRGWVNVPQVTGLPFEKARQKLYDVGLRLSVTDKAYDPAVPEDAVVSQSPLPGERMNTAERRAVNAIMSKGPETATVPDVRNMVENLARREIRKLGFQIGKVTTKYDDEAAKDMVMLVAPKPGSVISREIPVELTVSKGPEPTHATVPNLVGETLADAKKLLDDDGLKVGRIDIKYSSTSQPGSVLSQSLSPGANVPLGSPVNLIVCAGTTGAASPE